MRINLPTGNTINISVYEYLFVLKDEDMDLFYQACVADNLGTYIENPFSTHAQGELSVEEEDLPETPQE